MDLDFGLDASKNPEIVEKNAITVEYLLQRIIEAEKRILSLERQRESLKELNEYQKNIMLSYATRGKGND